MEPRKATARQTHVAMLQVYRPLRVGKRLCGHLAVLLLASAACASPAQSPAEALTVHVNRKASGTFSTPDPSMGGTHAESTHVRLVPGGFRYEYKDVSGGQTITRRGLVKWIDIEGVRASRNSGYTSRFDAELLLVKPSSYREWVWNGTSEVRDQTANSLLIGFPDAEMAAQCVVLARQVIGLEWAKRRFPSIRIEVDGKVPSPVEEYPRLINGVAYARVCSLSSALGIKMLNANYEEVQITRENQLWTWPVGQREIHVIGLSGPTPNAPIQIGASIFFPVRYTCQMLGYLVEWDKATSTLSIYTQPANRRKPAPGGMHLPHPRI